MAEANFWKKSIDGQAGYSFQLVDVEGPTNKSKANAWDIYMSVAHEGFILAHVAMTNAFSNLVARFSALVARELQPEGKGHTPSLRCSS